MEAYVIKRKDGKYYGEFDIYGDTFGEFYKDIVNAKFLTNEDDANDIIGFNGLDDCKPVKVRIEEVENG